MKRFFLWAFLPLFILLSAFSTFPHPANVPASRTAITAAAASSSPVTGDYACILTNDTFFYSSPDERRGLFLLPKSYYVKLLEYRTDFCKIEYGKDEGDCKRLIGYAKTEELTFVDYEPKRPYLYYVFDVSYKLDGTETPNGPFLNEIILSCVYYGDYLVGSELYCYVLQESGFGYVPKPTSLSFEENTEYADYLATQAPPPESSNEPTNSESTSSPMQIVILIAVCLLVPILAALVLKPSRRLPYKDDDAYSF